MQEFQQGVDRVNQEQLEQQQQRADAENNVVDAKKYIFENFPPMIFVRNFEKIYF